MSQGVIENLIEQLSKLPGIGRKTAQRLAFHLLRVPAEEVDALAGAMVEAVTKRSTGRPTSAFSSTASPCTLVMSGLPSGCPAMPSVLTRRAGSSRRPASTWSPLTRCRMTRPVATS